MNIKLYTFSGLFTQAFFSEEKFPFSADGTAGNRSCYFTSNQSTYKTTFGIDYYMFFDVFSCFTAKGLLFFK